MPAPFDVKPYLPQWAQAQTRPMQQALHAIFILMDSSAPGVDLQIAGLRYPGQPRETLREIAAIDCQGETGVQELLGILTACRAENAGRHSNILVRPDPAQSHPWLFLDDLPTQRALALCNEMAGLVTETSKNNCQVRLLADAAMTCEARAGAQKILQSRLGSDQGSTSGEKWGRLPGFTNQKMDKRGQWTNLLADTTGIRPPAPTKSLFSLHPQGGVCTTAVDFLSSLSPAAAAPSRPTAGLSLSSPRDSAALKPTTKADFARDALALPLPPATEGARGWRQEYADACQALRAGLPHPEIVESLAARALERGKRRTLEAARQYAESVLKAALKVEPAAA